MFGILKQSKSTDERVSVFQKMKTKSKKKYFVVFFLLIKVVLVLWIF